MTPTFEVISLAPWVVFALIALLLFTDVWSAVRTRPAPKSGQPQRKERNNPRP